MELRSLPSPLADRNESVRTGGEPRQRILRDLSQRIQSPDVGESYKFVLAKFRNATCKIGDGVKSNSRAFADKSTCGIFTHTANVTEPKAESQFVLRSLFSVLGSFFVPRSSFFVRALGFQFPVLS